MRVVLCDDSALFRRGLALLLESLGATVLAEVDSVERLHKTVAADVPDAVIVDIRMPPTFTDEGLVAAERLRSDHQDLAVLVLSTYVETSYTLRLLADDAHGVGYLLKDRVDDPDALVTALERLVQGETVVDPEVVSRMLRPRVTATALDTLTVREREILDLVAQGRTNGAIAGALFLSQKTIEAHVAAIFNKLGLATEPESNRRVLAVLAYLRASDGVAARQHTNDPA